MSHLFAFKTDVKPSLITAIVISALSLGTPLSATADIKELNSSELTETYIEDATIVVKKRATAETKENDTKFKIKPIGSPPALLEHDQAIVNTQDKQQERLSEELLRESQLLELIQQDNTLATGSATIVPYRTEAQLARDQFIKQELGLPMDQPLDLTTLGFGPGTFTGNTDLGDGRAVSFPDGSFQIVIPNTKAIDPTSFSNHDKTFNTTVTPESIILQIVNPHLQQ